MTCYRCGKISHYANDCKVIINAGKPPQRVHNYALQVDEDTLIKNVEEAPEEEPAPEGHQTEVDDDEPANGLDREQYDPDDTYALEMLEKDSSEAEDKPYEWAGAVFIDEDEEYCRAVQVPLTPKTEDFVRTQLCWLSVGLE